MARINLMARYPKTNRNSFIDRSAILSEEQISLAREFGKEYFDGSREMGLGGYYYDPRFFRPVVEDLIRYYNLNGDLLSKSKHSSNLNILTDGKRNMHFFDTRFFIFKGKKDLLNLVLFDIFKYYITIESSSQI
jgi:hypothetical protein